MHTIMKKTFSMLFMMLAMAVSMSAQAVDKEYTAEINKMLEATHAKETMVKTVAIAWQQMKLPIANYNEAAQAMYDDLWPDLVQDFVSEYKKHFTIEDMRAINRFYSTPTGKKMGMYSTEMSANIQNTVSTKYAARMQNVLMKYVKQ